MMVALLVLSLASVASAAAAAAPVEWSVVVSAATGECWDTRGLGYYKADQVDLYACDDDGDGHNERFRRDASTGLVHIGPGDQGPGVGSRSVAGYCLRGLTASQAAAAGMYSSVQVPCNASDTQQLFELVSGHTLRCSVNGAPHCLTAGPPKPDTSLLLEPCAACSKAQQWSFKPLSSSAPWPFAPPG
jgi:hypothetical protein